VIAGAPDAFWGMLQHQHAPAFWSAEDAAEYRARFFAPAAVHAVRALSRPPCRAR
jgi:hypothetical protein